MDMILILFAVKSGAIFGMYLGTYETPDECVAAAQRYSKAPPVELDAGRLMCIAKKEV